MHLGIITKLHPLTALDISATPHAPCHRPQQPRTGNPTCTTPAATPRGGCWIFPRTAETSPPDAHQKAASASSTAGLHVPPHRLLSSSTARLHGWMPPGMCQQALTPRWHCIVMPVQDFPVQDCPGPPGHSRARCPLQWQDSSADRAYDQHDQALHTPIWTLLEV